MKNIMSCHEDEVLDRIDQLIVNNKIKDREINQLVKSNQKYKISALIENAINYSDIRIIISQESNVRDMKDFGANINESCSTSFIAVIGSILNDKPMLVCSVSSDIYDKIGANEIIAFLAKIIDGGGGGKKSIATAGGKDINKIDEALKESIDFIKGLIDERL